MNVEDSTFIDVNSKSFSPSLTRVLAHELGHVYILSKYGFVGFSANYHGAITYENKIASQLDPQAPIRHPSLGHEKF